MSFSVPGEVDGLRVTAGWGDYQRVRSEVPVTAQGRQAVVWRRRPVEATGEVDLDGDTTVISSRQRNVSSYG
ncbi:MAG: hypothetical protein M3137_20070 [Actinomycetota bacterium]|nr:hypothetical protein [Actinomycetota bacterium]